MRTLVLALVSSALVGCGTTGNSFFKERRDASYIMVTEGELQGSLTNSEIRGCKVTFSGIEELPFDEFEYTDSGCILRKGEKSQ